MKTRVAFFTLIVLALSLSACNLSRATPTPTFAPPTTPPPTLAPDVTPIVVEGANGELCIIPSDWYPYVIEQSDTLSLLAQQTASTQEELTRVNCLSNPNNLVAGETIYVPRPPVIGG
mgnify:CR=1 FL=1